DVNAQVGLGNVFAEGLYGVPRNADEAARWYQRAALAGNSVGQYMLGSCYEQGKGAPKNLEQAANWYRKSANQGYVSAQAALGNLYLNGQGVERDQLEAYKWLALAAAHGDVQANDAKLKLAKTLPLRDLVDAEYRAGSFRPVDSSLAGRKPQDDSPAPRSLEAGFFVTTNGYFLAPLHVIKDAKKVMVKTRTGLFPARLVKADISADLALLKVAGSFTCLSVAAQPNPALTVSVPQFNNEDWKAVRISLQPAKIVGKPADLTNTFNVQLDRSAENAGGCLVDPAGSAVGLATFQQFPSNLNKPRFQASTFAALKRILQTLPEARAGVKWATPAQQNAAFNPETVLNASALVLAY
ncbi:MAG: SEL1-like repeat protein, partial [Verrucomicrobiales bacterium]|nr:SEL1-like repeat protein [Verrucomicrobiales bacterium]